MADALGGAARSASLFSLFEPPLLSESTSSTSSKKSTSFFPSIFSKLSSWVLNIFSMVSSRLSSISSKSSTWSLRISSS